MGKLTTHVLDTANGCPAAHMNVRLYRGGHLVVETKTNNDGRCDKPLLEGENMQPGPYRLEFDAAPYFKAKGVTLPSTPFLDTVTLNFGISDAAAHYHVPLLVSPYGYSTYRGS